MADTTSTPPESAPFDFGLGLDPSDPLNLLLHNSPADTFMDEPSTSESSSAGSPPDWNQLEQLWASEAANPPKFSGEDIYGFGSNMMDFNFQPMYDPMTVDTTSSHYDAAFAPMIPFASLSKPSFSPDISANEGSEISPFSFAFTPLTLETEFANTNGKPRRLSNASSVSSSGASLSPVPSVMSDTSAAASSGPVPTPFPVISPNQAASTSKSEESAEELAQRIRQSAGVLLAVSSTSPQLAAPQHLPSTAKLPIPRLPRPSKPATKLKQAPTSGSSTPSLTDSGSPEPPSMPPPIMVTSAATGRPKTSHTTIERRYRTNLNARIQALRSAVPALRVLDAKAAAAAGDVIDAQGLVDGVRAARKGSKATVLGKAVEYIRVLKRREMRLTREHEGLRSLIGGLVGGPALLREWEAAWRERFGGAEKDALDGEEEEDDEDEDEDGSGGEDEGGRAKKKVKVAPVKKEKKVVSDDGKGGAVTGEKRKRGRPRKVVPGAEVPSSATVPQSFPPQLAQQPPQHQGQPGQYLLAVFALFSFANSPLTSPAAQPHAHTHHTGTVIGHSGQHHLIPPPPTTGWRDILQAVHFIATILVLLSVAAPWMPSRSTLGKALNSSPKPPPFPSYQNPQAYQRPDPSHPPASHPTPHPPPSLPPPSHPHLPTHHHQTPPHPTPSSTPTATWRSSSTAKEAGRA